MGDGVTTQGSAIGDRAWAERPCPGLRRSVSTTDDHTPLPSRRIEREGGRWKDY